MKGNQIKRICGVILWFACSILYSEAQVKDQLKISSKDFQMVQYGLYERIEGFNSYIGEEGYPELPVITRSYVLPIDAQLKGVTLIQSPPMMIGQNILLYPKQADIIFKDRAPRDWVNRNARIYGANQLYPGKLYEVAYDRMEQGYHIVTLNLYPFQYNPAKRELSYSDFDLTLEYETTDLSEVQTAEVQTLYRYELTAQSVRSYVSNPQDVDRFGSNVQRVYEGKRLVRSNAKLNKGIKKAATKVPSVLEEVIPDYLIITNQALKGSFERLADWKSKKGVFTRIVTVEDIAAEYSGIDQTDRIRNYLRKSVTLWGAGLFVLLGGDIEVVPSRLVKGETRGAVLFYPTDAYYKDMTAYQTAIFPDYESKKDIRFSLDLPIGRLPVKSPMEVLNYTEKLIQYEKAVVEDRSYYRNNLYGSAYQRRTDKGLMVDCLHDTIKVAVLKSNAPSYINHKYIFDKHDYANSSIYDIVDWASGDIELNHDNMLQLMNHGGLGVGKFHFLFLTDHGSTDNMGTSSIDKKETMSKFEMDQLTNGAYAQILFAGQCHPADFSKDCFGEHYLKNPSGGGVAYISNTDIGYGDELPNQLANFLRNLYSSSFYSKHIGVLINQLFDRGLSKYSNYRLHLLGDPEMPIWTNLSVQVFGQNGTQSILIGSERVVQVVISNLPAGKKARICVRKGTEIYETREVTNGTWQIPVVARTEGLVEITVTAQDFVPYEITLNASATNAPNIYISSILLDDDRNGASIGNGDGLNNTGETIEMNVTFANSGLMASSPVLATINKKPSFITLTNTSVVLPTIAPDSVATGVFVYKISPSAGDLPTNSNNKDSLYFEVTMNGELWTQRFKLENYNHSVNHVYKLSSPLTPGAEVDVTIVTTNTSQSAINNISLNIRPGITTKHMIESYDLDTVFIPILLPNVSVTNIFRLKLSATYTGDALIVLNGKSDLGKSYLSIVTLIDKAEAPQPMSVTYTDKDITLKIPDHVYGGKYILYRSLSEVGPYERITPNPIEYPSYKDETVVPLTTYYYRYSVLNRFSESDLSAPITGYTTFPLFAQFPIQIEATYGMVSSGINAVDTDGDGKKEIFAAMRYAISSNENFGKVIGLNYDGTELYNIDGNTTINFGFADFNERFEATPAIADLKQTGNMQVVCMTRSTTAGTSSLKCYSLLDEDGDHKPDLIGSRGGINDAFRGPIVTNLDYSEDGSEEVIGYTLGGDVYMYSIDPYHKTVHHNWSINPSGGKWSTGAYAVGDVDGDGNKELVYVHRDQNIYIISPNGSVNKTIQSPGRYFNGSVVLADLNYDGVDEIITTLANTNAGNENRHIVVYRYSGGSYVRYGNWTDLSSQLISDRSEIGTLECSVGDIDGDGRLEIVASGNKCVKVWSHDGILKSTIPTDYKNETKVVPILADVDGDPEIEIILPSGCSPKLYAYKMSTGGQAKGFPIEVANSSTYTTPCVSDIDGDGYNELIAAADEIVYAWKTLGRSDRIEWGSERHDSRNSGRYYKTPPQSISGLHIWNVRKEIYSDHYITSGTRLTITSPIHSLNNARIIVEEGGELIIDGGTLLFADIEVQPGGRLELKNNAKVVLSRKGLLNVLDGGVFDNQSGEIIPLYQNF